MATKKNGNPPTGGKIQEEREKRQQQLVQLEYMIGQQEQSLSNLRVARLKCIGALEQLDELEGIKPPDPSENGEPVKEKVAEKQA